MNTTHRTTIREVAQAAGVSAQTVSRVVNDRPDVSEDTRRRVQDAIETLGYSPNVLARSLIHGRSNCIGVIGYGLGYYGPARILTGIERRAAELGYSLQLSLLRRPELHSGAEAFQSLIDRRVDGVIWAVPEIGNNREWLAEAAHRRNVALVGINLPKLGDVPIAAIDNRLGGRMATEHLLQQQVGEVGLIAGPATWYEAQQREQGWRDALSAAGIKNIQRLMVAGDWYPASGALGLMELLSRTPNLRAVFACNDPMAAGALQAARQLGRRVPEDLAIVGFDDVPEAAYYHPALTTVRQPLLDLGAQAVDLLHALTDNRPAPQPDEEIAYPSLLQPQLVVRNSSVVPVPLPPLHKEK